MINRVFDSKAIILGSLTVALLVGCAGDKATNAPATSPSGSEPAKPAQSKGDLKDLKTEVISKGTGAGAANGDLLVMKYTGKLLDGSVFDTNDKPNGAPFSFQLGNGLVIQGWDKGLVGAKLGSKLKLSVPWKMGYGEKGSGEKIPPKADLYFDVEVLAIIKKGDEDAVVVKDTKVGTGPEAVKGSKIKISYEGTLLTGKKFNAFENLDITLGKSKFRVKGLESALYGMKKGGERDVTVPPAVGYGPSGQGLVPPNSILKFKIKMIDVK